MTKLEILEKAMKNGKLGTLDLSNLKIDIYKMTVRDTYEGLEAEVISDSSLKLGDGPPLRVPSKSAVSFKFLYEQPENHPEEVIVTVKFSTPSDYKGYSIKTMIIRADGGGVAVTPDGNVDVTLLGESYKDVELYRLDFDADGNIHNLDARTFRIGDVVLYGPITAVKSATGDRIVMGRLKESCKLGPYTVSKGAEVAVINDKLRAVPLPPANSTYYTSVDDNKLVVDVENGKIIFGVTRGYAYAKWEEGTENYISKNRPVILANIAKSYEDMSHFSASFLSDGVEFFGEFSRIDIKGKKVVRLLIGDRDVEVISPKGKMPDGIKPHLTDVSEREWDGVSTTRGKLPRGVIDFSTGSAVYQKE